MKHPYELVWTEQAASLDPPELTIIAKSMIAARRAIHGPIPSELIHDTALDFLLHLFVADSEHLEMKVEALARQTSVAHHTALRWIDVLIQYHFVEQIGTLVALNAKGNQTVSTMLRAVAASQWHLGD